MQELTKEELHEQLLRLPVEDGNEMKVHKMCPQLDFPEIMAAFDHAREAGLAELFAPPILVKGQSHRLQILRREDKSLRISLEYALGTSGNPQAAKAEAYAWQRWGSDMIKDDWWGVIHLRFLDPVLVDRWNFSQDRCFMVVAMRNGWEGEVMNTHSFFTQIRVASADPVIRKEINKSTWGFRYACGACATLLAGPSNQQTCSQCEAKYVVDMRKGWYWQQPFLLPSMLIDEAKKHDLRFEYWEELQTKPLELPSLGSDPQSEDDEAEEI